MRFAFNFFRLVLFFIFLEPLPAYTASAYDLSDGVLWSANLETGTLDQWVESTIQNTPCGGEFSGNGGFTLPTQEKSKSGLWSAKMVIPGESVGGYTAGTRMHRWCESQRYRELFYSVWYYIPTKFTVHRGGWLNWFQFKSKRPNGQNDPFFFLDVKNSPSTGEMNFMLTWWQGLKIEGPSAGQSGYRTWSTSRSIPIRQWVHIEARYVCAGDFSGAIQIWQDGVQIFRLEGVRTRHSDGDCQWGVNNYGTGVSPSPVEFYIDDAVISTKRLAH